MQRLGVLPVPSKHHMRIDIGSAEFSDSVYSRPGTPHVLQRLELLLVPSKHNMRGCDCFELHKDQELISAELIHAILFRLFPFTLFFFISFSLY